MWQNIVGLLDVFIKNIADEWSFRRLECKVCLFAVLWERLFDSELLTFLYSLVCTHVKLEPSRFAFYSLYFESHGCILILCFSIFKTWSKVKECGVYIKRLILSLFLHYMLTLIFLLDFLQWVEMENIEKSFPSYAWQVLFTYYSSTSFLIELFGFLGCFFYELYHLSVFTLFVLKWDVIDFSLAH